MSAQIACPLKILTGSFLLIPRCQITFVTNHDTLYRRIPCSVATKKCLRHAFFSYLFTVAEVEQWAGHASRQAVAMRCDVISRFIALYPCRCCAQVQIKNLLIIKVLLETYSISCYVYNVINPSSGGPYRVVWFVVDQHRPQPKQLKYKNKKLSNTYGSFTFMITYLLGTYCRAKRVFKAITSLMDKYTSN